MHLYHRKEARGSNILIFLLLWTVSMPVTHFRRVCILWKDSPEKASASSDLMHRNIRDPWRIVCYYQVGTMRLAHAWLGSCDQQGLLLPVLVFHPSMTQKPRRYPVSPHSFDWESTWIAGIHMSPGQIGFIYFGDTSLSESHYHNAPS